MNLHHQTSSLQYQIYSNHEEGEPKALFANASAQDLESVPQVQDRPDGAVAVEDRPEAPAR